MPGRSNRMMVVAALAVLAAAAAVPARAEAQYGTAYLTRRLGELHGQYAVGMSQWGPAQTGTLRAGASRSFDFVLAAGGCYKFIAVGDGDVTDLDLHVRRNREEVARDTATDNFPVASHCTTDEARVSVEVRMVSGRGEFAFGIYQGAGGTLPLTQVGNPAPSPAATSPAPAVPAPAPVQAPPPPPADPMSQRLFGLSQSFAPGSGLVGQVRRGVLGRGDEQDLAIRLERGHCYTVIAVGAPSARDVDMYLFDPNRDRVTSDRERNNFPHMTHCATLPGAYRVRVRMYRGDGPYVMGVFDHAGGRTALSQLVPPRPAGQAPTGSTLQVRAPADPLVQRLTQLAGSLAPGQRPASAIFRGALDTHGRQDFLVNLEAGRCYTIIAAGGPGARDVDMYLFDPNQSRKTSDRERNNFPHMTHCAALPGPYTVRIQMYRGAGPFVAQVFGQ